MTDTATEAAKLPDPPPAEPVKTALGEPLPKTEEPPKIETPTDGEKKPTEEPKTALGAEPPKKEEEKKEPANEFHGAPKDGKYEPFTLPDGYEVDQAAVDSFAPIAAKLGLGQKGAQELVNLYLGMQEKSAASWADEVKTMGETAAKDKEFGGAAYADNLVIAKSALRDFGTPELQQALDFSGFGNHPEFIRFAYRVGKALSEGKARGGNTPGAEKRPAHETLYGATKE